MLSLKKEFFSIIKSERLTHTILLFGITLLCIFHLLPHHIQISISNFFRIPIISLISLLLIITIGYFNMSSGILILLLFTCVLIPLNTNNNSNSENNFNNKKTKLNLENSYVIESFKSNSKKKSKVNKVYSEDDENNDEDEDDDYLETKLTGNKTISNFFKPGYFRKKLINANNYNKEKFSQQNAKNNHEKYINTRKKGMEKFSNTNKEDFVAIEKRKFNPANEEDTNFLLALEIFKDIINRIEYKYENKKNCKKYIKNQIEDVIEKLDLVPEE